MAGAMRLRERMDDMFDDWRANHARTDRIYRHRVLWMRILAATWTAALIIRCVYAIFDIPATIEFLGVVTAIGISAMIGFLIMNLIHERAKRHFNVKDYRVPLKLFYRRRKSTLADFHEDLTHLCERKGLEFIGDAELDMTRKGLLFFTAKHPVLDVKISCVTDGWVIHTV